MDINVTVAKMRELAADMHAWQDGGEDPDEPGEYYRIASEMVEGFDAMDGWLTEEGFAPESWPLRSRRDLLAMEQRAFRLRNALLEAGVSENLVRAVELGGTEQEARAILRTNGPVDPNETLTRLRQLVADMTAIQNGDDDPDEPGEYYRIASETTTLVEALDEWLTKGGSLPSPWARFYQKAVTTPLRTLHPRTGDLRTESEVRQPDGLPRGIYRTGSDL